MPQDIKEIIQLKHIDHEQVDEKQQAALRAKFKENLAKQNAESKKRSTMHETSAAEEQQNRAESILEWHTEVEIRRKECIHRIMWLIQGFNFRSFLLTNSPLHQRFRVGNKIQDPCKCLFWFTLRSNNKEVEMVDSVDDLKSSKSVAGHILICQTLSCWTRGLHLL